MHRMLIGLLLILCTGCPKNNVIRNTEVYKAELTQWDNWAVRQAGYLRHFVESNCACESEAEGPQFQDALCEEAADWLLTVEARHEWHKQLALYNAYLIEEEPSQTPPVIPHSTCPLPAKEGN